MGEKPDLSKMVGPKQFIRTEVHMQDKRIALVTGANQGIGLQIAKDLVAHGLTVLVGSRRIECGVAAAKEAGPSAHALQLDVTDQRRSAPRRSVFATSLDTWTCSSKTQRSRIRISNPLSPSRNTQLRLPQQRVPR